VAGIKAGKEGIETKKGGRDAIFFFDSVRKGQCARLRKNATTKAEAREEE
jgi:hypothetical protein